MVIKSDQCLDGEHSDCPVEHEVCECVCHVEHPEPDEKLPMAEHGHGLKELMNRREYERR